MSVFLLASFFYYYLFFLHLTKTKNFLSKALVIHCFLVFRRIRWIHFLSSVLSVLSTSPVVVHSFLRKRTFFHILEITPVVVLYTSLRFVEGVYKPQRACVGWASVTESCLKRTCLDEFPLGHPKMFERTLDVISLFVLAISNTMSLFPILCVCCSLWKR